MNTDTHRFEGSFFMGRVISAAAATLLCLAPAPAAEAPAQPTTPAARLEAARAEIALTRSNIVFTLEQLDNIRRAENPQAQFQRFVEQLASMKERAKLTQERAQLMKSRGDAYFAQWEAPATANPEARRQAEDLHAKRKTSYDLIIEQMQLARTKFEPLLKELEEIKTLLEGDRSKEKIAAAKDVFSQANWNCVEVQRALMRTENELGFVADDLSGKYEGAPSGLR
jgi:hypothetical protein